MVVAASCFVAVFLQQELGPWSSRANYEQLQIPVYIGTKPSGFCLKAEDEEEIHLSAQQQPKSYIQINKRMASPE